MNLICECRLEGEDGTSYGYRFEVDSKDLPSDGKPVARHVPTEQLAVSAVKACLLQNRTFAANGKPDPFEWSEAVCEPGLQRFVRGFEPAPRADAKTGRKTGRK